MRTTSPLHKYIEGFRLHCVAEGKSYQTTRWYAHKLGIFARYLERQHVVDDVSEVTTEHVRAFLVYLREEVRAGDLNPHRPAEDRPLSPHTIQGYHRTVKVFFRWLVREGHLDKDPTRYIRRPKAPASVVETFDSDQVRRLLAAPNRGTAVGYRDYCIMLLLLDTGIRLSELVRLRLTDLHLKEGYLIARGKGGKERLVPIGNSVRKTLWRYMTCQRPEPAHPGVESLFLGRDGRPLQGRGVYSMIVRRGQQAGLVGVRCSPHTFRHTFAVTYLRNGGDTFSLQRILGHTSLVVTRMYVNLVNSDIRTQHQRCSPVDRMT